MTLSKADLLTPIGFALMALFMACFLDGCCNITITKPDGTVVKYRRFGNQEIGSFIYENDAILFEQQRSDNAELYQALNKLVDKIP